MRNFFANQSYLQLAKTFGYLDIYEYVDSKSSFYIYFVTESSIVIQSNLTLQENWTISNLASFNDWEEFLNQIKRLHL